MSIMKQSYESYLKSFYSDKGVEYTHTRIGDNNLSIKGGVYTINNTDEFYQKYNEYLKLGGQPIDGESYPRFNLIILNKILYFIKGYN